MTVLSSISKPESRICQIAQKILESYVEACSDNAGLNNVYMASGINFHLQAF